MWFDYIVVPLLIMIARVTDVSLDTIRVIMVAKGYRNLAPFVGFFQVLIWIITISRIISECITYITICIVLGRTYGDTPLKNDVILPAAYRDKDKAVYP